MKITVTVDLMKERFMKMDRNYYSWEGLESLLDYYDEIDENMELDVIAICSDCTEYGENCTCSFDDLIRDYGYKYTEEEYMEDNCYSEYDEEDYITALIEKLEEYTTVLHISNGNYIVFEF